LKGLNSLGLVYSRYGDNVKALQLFEEAEGYLQNVLDPILNGRILISKAIILFKRDHFADLLTRHTRETLFAAQNDLKVDASDRVTARRLLNSVIQSLLPTNSRELATAYHNLGELCLMERKNDEAIDCFSNAIQVAEIENDTYTLVNSLQRLTLTAYIKDDLTQFQEFKKKFDSARLKLTALEETARYVMRYYITVGNFYYDKLFKDSGEKNFAENFREAFGAYTDAFLHTRSYAKGSTEFAQEVFAERIFDVLKSKTVPQNLRDELLKKWQENELNTNDLQRYFDF